MPGKVVRCSTIVGGMERFRGEQAVMRRIGLTSALAGAALGIAAAAGGVTVLSGAGASMTGVAVVATTLMGSLLVGLWAGAPAASRGALPVRERWVSAGISFALAGAVAAVWRVYSTVNLTSIGQMVAMLALVSIPAYAVGLLLPLIGPAGAPATEPEDEPRDVTGRVVAGALAGAAVAVPLTAVVLIPWFGAPALLLATSVVLFLPLMRVEPDTHATVETVLREVQSPHATLRVTEVSFPGERQPERRLYLDDEQESGELVRSGAPTLAYVAAAEAWLTREQAPGLRYLFLGGGGYTLPRRIAERDESAVVTVVEVDAEVTRLAYRYFGVRADHAITTVTGDARAHLERDDGERYDRIYMDVYSGSEAVPYHLVTREAFTALRNRLAPGGALAMNLIGVTSGPESLRMWSIVRTVMDVLPHTALYLHLGADFPDLQNLLLIATPEEGRRFPDAAGIFSRWPADQWGMPPAAPVLRDLYPTSDGRAASAPSASRPGSAG